MNESINVLKCITTVLKPVQEITDHLAGEDNVTASAIYPVIFNLKNKLSDIVNENHNDNVSDKKCREINTKIFASKLNSFPKKKLLKTKNVILKNAWNHGQNGIAIATPELEELVMQLILYFHWIFLIIIN